MNKFDVTYMLSACAALNWKLIAKTKSSRKSRTGGPTQPCARRSNSSTKDATAPISELASRTLAASLLPVNSGDDGGGGGTAKRCVYAVDSCRSKFPTTLLLAHAVEKAVSRNASWPGRRTNPLCISARFVSLHAHRIKLAPTPRMNK